jgi:putative transposase
VIGGRVEARLKQIINEVVAEAGGLGVPPAGGGVIEVVGVPPLAGEMPDHVHLLMEVPPTVALSPLIQKLKGRSSRRLRAEFPHLRRLPALWSPSWNARTVGGAPLEVVRLPLRLRRGGTPIVENQKLAG